METFEMLQLKSSIAQLVDEFSERYFDKVWWEAVGVNEGMIPEIFEFCEYYVYSLEDIYTAMYYQMSKEIVIRWYEERSGNINLKTFYIRNRNK